MITQEKDISITERILVVPGEELGDDSFKAGTGTYWRQGKIFASHLGLKNVRSGYINVIPLGGRYLPRTGDSVIGIINDVGPSSWIVLINCPYPALLHVSETPWKVDFGDTVRYLMVGDVILTKISQVDEIKRVQLTIKEHGLRKLTNGHIVNISHSKVPRMIGKGGSMISIIKEYTGCRIFVGQNGVVWLDGDREGISLASAAIDLIERDAQKFGLTDAVRDMLRSESTGRTIPEGEAQADTVNDIEDQDSEEGIT